ncbi:MAG: hypothetical protein HYY01_10580 [Chloroflexi bacterium]|nr:hypothetical protein [Chloroflexota bacterium]
MIRKLQGKLSRAGTIALVLLVTAVLLNVGLRVAQARQADTEETLTARVRQARIALDRAVEDADTTALATKKVELEAALAQSGVALKDATQVTLDLWKWADRTNLDMRGLTVESTKSKIADMDVVAHTYAVAGRGSPDSIQRFVAAAVAAPYLPTVTKLEVKHQVGKADTDFNLDLVVYALGK